MIVSPTTSELFDDTRRYGGALVIAGVLGGIAGILAIAYPDVTLLTIALIAGINLLLLGIANLVDAFGGERDATGRVLCAVIGVLGIVAGLVVMRRPGESLLAIVVVLGIWLVVAGIIDLVRALVSAEGRGLRLLAGLADLIFGILILALPHLSLATLAVLVGLSFVVRGVVSVVRGIRLRRASPALAPDAHAPTAPA